MANEIRYDYTAGFTLYATIQNPAGQFWNGTALEALNASHWGTYALALTPQSIASLYYATMPVGITTAGTYTVKVYRQLGASPATTDPLMDVLPSLYWSGTALFDAAVALSSLTGMLVPTDPTLVTIYGYEGTQADPVVGAQVMVRATAALSFAGSRRFATLALYTNQAGYWSAQVPASTAMRVSVAGTVKSLTSPASGSANWKDLS